MRLLNKLAVGAVVAAVAANPSLAGPLSGGVATAVALVQGEMAREGLTLPWVSVAPPPNSAVKTGLPSAKSGGTAPQAAGPRRKPAAGQATAPRAPVGKPWSHAFETANRSGVPARWNTCNPIPLVLLTKGATPDVIRDVRAALAQVNAATGLRFTVTGTANRALTVHELYDPTLPVMVGFATGRSGVFPDANTAGLATVSVLTDANTTTSAAVGFNTDLLGTYTPGSTGADPRMVLFLHEFAHMAGLDHVQDKTQVMYPSTGYARTFGAGDLAGLRALASHGCAPGK